MNALRSVCYVLILVIYTATLVRKNNLASASEIECLPIDQCHFANKIIKRSGTKNAPFFMDTVCGYEKSTIKIWCNKFLECRISDKLNGTCIPLDYCEYYLNSVERGNIEHLRCNTDHEKEVHICCPNPPQEKASNIEYIKQKITEFYKNNRNLQKQRLVRTKRHFPDFSLTNNDYLSKGPLSLWPHDDNFPRFHHRITKNDDNNSSQNRHYLNVQRPHWPFHNHYHEPHTLSFHNDQNSYEHFHDDSLESTEKNEDSYKKYHGGHFTNWEANHPEDETLESFSKSGAKNLPCTTVNGETGHCQPFYHCQPVLKFPHKHNYPENFNKHSHSVGTCNDSNNSEKLVCCPKDEKTNFNKTEIKDNNVTKVNNKQPTEKPNPDNSFFNSTESSLTEVPNNSGKDTDVLKSFDDICGTQEASDRILGGTGTDLGEFPWLALLQYSSRNGLEYGCAGSLITNKFVITAAHCVDTNILEQKSLGTLYRIILGEYDTRNETDCFYMKYGTSCADPAKYYSAEKTILHNLFQSTQNPLHDIALIKLTERVTFTDFIRPICLPNFSINLIANRRVIISGWGRTETEKISPFKRKASLGITSTNECNNYLQENNSALINGQLCLSSGNGTDSCNGDSGGPGMIQIRNPSKRIVFTLIGVISYGFRPCGQFPSVATNVSQYMSWIKDKIRD